MRHVYDHIVQLCCLRRRPSEENEMLHKKFKALYNTTTKHIDTLAPQLLRLEFPNFEAPDEQCDENTVETITTLPQAHFYSHNLVKAARKNHAWILYSPSVGLSRQI